MILPSKIGREEGEFNAKMLIAKDLLSLGLSIQQIMDATQLTESEINKLKD